MRLRQVTGFVVGQLPVASTRVIVYCGTQDRPVYVSEDIEPGNDGLVEWKLSSAAKTDQLSGRSIVVTLRVFQADADQPKGWKLTKEMTLDLRNLVPASKLSAGEEWAALSEDQRWYVPVNPSSLVTAKEMAQINKVSPTFGTLNELWTLQKVLDDVRASAAKLEAEVDRLIPDSPVGHSQRITELERRIAKTRRFTQRTKMLTEKARKRTEELKNSTKTTSENLGESCEAIHAASLTNSTQKELRLTTFEPQIRCEQGRLARQLLEIFPIEPAGPSFHFSICGLVLPSIFAINHYDPVQVAAALGLVAQLVVALSVYLDVALPYPVFPYGSQSYVIDDISQMKGSRVFPLWTKGALLYRVEYALYLLHKDIEQLVNSRDLAVADLKQTLANLKNLLLVLSAEG